MTQSEGRGIGGVGGSRWCTESEANLHHALNLLLACSTPTGDRLLHLIRRVLDDRASGAVRQGQHQATGLSHAHGGAHVDLEEHLLDGDAVRGELRQELLEIGVQTRQAGGQGLVDGCTEHPERYRPGLAAVGVYDGVSAAGQTRIDAEDTMRTTLASGAVYEHAYDHTEVPRGFGDPRRAVWQASHMSKARPSLVASSLFVGAILVSCSGSSDVDTQPSTTAESTVPTAPPCEGVRTCLLPWPDDRLTIPDPSTDTGRRLALPAAGAPVNVDGVVMDLSDQNRADGFSPNSAIVFAADGVDLAASGIPDSTAIEKSIETSMATSIVDDATGEPVPFWGELDGQSGLVTLRPAVSLTEGHTFTVTIGGLVDDVGAPITLERSSWSFTVASERSLAGRLLAMRDIAYESIGDGVPTFTVDSVTPGDVRTVEGTIDIPNVLDNDGSPGGTLLLDDDGLPRVNPEHPTYAAAYRCVVPNSVTTPAPALLYGHGLLGNRGQVDFFATFAAQGQIVGCAVDWLGMASEDLGNLAGILADMGRFAEQADRMLMGHIAFSMLGRLTNDPRGFASNAAFQNPDGTPVLAVDSTVFVGNSQGGILGGAASAVSSEWKRAVLGVPGINYSLLLPRSTDWPEFQSIFEAAYTDVDDRLMALMLVQLLWDRGENGGYAQHLTRDTYPGVEPKTVLLVEAFGDHQVANVSTEILARTIGAQVHTPALRAGRSTSSIPMWGIDAIEDRADETSKLVIWDYGTPAPPVGPFPPFEDRYGRDPHGAGSDEPLVLVQALTFLLDGELLDVCGGPCVGTQIDSQ